MALFDVQLANPQGHFWRVFEAPDAETAEENARWWALHQSATEFHRIQPVPENPTAPRPERQIELF